MLQGNTIFTSSIRKLYGRILNRSIVLKNEDIEEQSGLCLGTLVG